MAVRLNKLATEQTEALVTQNNLMVNQNKDIAHQSRLVADENKEVVKQGETMLSQNKLSEARNSSLAFLTRITTVFLPFTTIAAYMAIPHESGLGPESKGQWKYWISSGLLAAVLIFTFLIDTGGRSGMLIMRTKKIIESIHGCFRKEEEEEERKSGMVLLFNYAQLE
jgi:Mg2+ and Co2+ transporter CorA